MPSKKKKYNARFPPARIKKIMQTDEEVGKVAAAVPVIISRALELFIDSLIEKTASVTREKNARTLSSSHIKQAIHSEKMFDFLRDLVKNVPDHQADEEDGGLTASGSGVQDNKPKSAKPRKIKDVLEKVTDPNKKGPGRPRNVKKGPGRPRKVRVEEKQETASPAEDSEETETDEEQNYSEPDQGSHGQVLPAASEALATATNSAPGQASNMPVQAFQANSVTPMLPTLQSPPMQPYPVHNIPFSQFPYPIQMAQGNPSPFIPPSALSSGQDNNPSPHFMPPMVPPFLPPFMNLPQQGFMMPSAPPTQEGSTYLNLSPSVGFGPLIRTEQEKNVASHQQDMAVGKQCVQTDGSTSNDSSMPLDMTVSGKSRSQSVAELQPRIPGVLSAYDQDDNNARTTHPPHHGLSNANSQQSMLEKQSEHSMVSKEQKIKGKNGPLSNLNQGKSHLKDAENLNLHKNAVKAPSDFSSGDGKDSVVPKKDRKSENQNSIQYETLSSLMNRGPTNVSIDKDDDDDYDT